MTHRAAPALVPTWASRVFDAPARFQDIALLRERLARDPTLLTRRVLPQIVRASSESDEDPEVRCWMELAGMVRCYLEHKPAAARARSVGASQVAERVAAVGKAADDLYLALKSLNRCAEKLRRQGVEPTLLATWFPFEVADPSLSTKLRTIAMRAAQRGSRPERASNYASVAGFVAELDQASQVRLSNPAVADLWEFLHGQRVTPEAIGRARTRTLRQQISPEVARIPAGT